MTIRNLNENKQDLRKVKKDFFRKAIKRKKAIKTEITANREQITEVLTGILINYCTMMILKLSTDKLYHEKFKFFAFSQTFVGDGEKYFFCKNSVSRGYMLGVRLSRAESITL